MTIIDKEMKLGWKPDPANEQLYESDNQEVVELLKQACEEKDDC